MNNAINVLAKSIAGKNSLAEYSEEQIALLAASHPSFAPIQVLLCKKQQLSGSPGYEEQRKKASLYVPNILWLNTLLSDGNSQEIQPIIIKEEDKPGPVLQLPQEPEAEEIQVPAETSVSFMETGNEEDEEYDQESEEATNADEPVLKIAELKMEPLDMSKVPLTFEPLHTIDYFASQGIKYKEEDKPKDRLSQQLKSFTEWIKTMKRLPPTELAARNENVVEEKKVEQLAAHSISDQKVLTEAMAEVWEKQGNTEKAAEVYRKLSLLDPAKSSYFAAKIEQLKKPS